MIDEEVVNKYKEQFLNLHVKVTFGKKAPHKPIMLLSIIDLIETNVISSNHFRYTEQLDSQFHHNWSRYVSYIDGFTQTGRTPFWHLSYEPFWQIILRRECSKSFKELSDARIYTQPKKMDAAVDHVEISPDLFEILQSSTVRARMRVLLISSYLQY